MWSSDRLLRQVMLGLSLSMVILVTGCTLTPVYSEANTARTSLQLAFAAPNSRLEQIIYQDLAFRFPTTESVTAPLLTVTTSGQALSPSMSATTNPVKTALASLTATVTIAARDGSKAEPITIVRVASASYTSDGQAGANAATVNGAYEQAARAVAEQLRLAILSAMMR